MRPQSACAALRSRPEPPSRSRRTVSAITWAGGGARARHSRGGAFAQPGGFGAEWRALFPLHAGEWGSSRSELKFVVASCLLQGMVTNH